MTARNHRPPSPTNPTAWIWLIVIAIASSVDGSTIHRIIPGLDSPGQPRGEVETLLPNRLSEYERHYRSAQNYFNEQEYARAERSLEKALAAESHHPEAHLLLARILRGVWTVG